MVSRLGVVGRTGTMSELLEPPQRNRGGVWACQQADQSASCVPDSSRVKLRGPGSRGLLFTTSDKHQAHFATVGNGRCVSPIWI